ncbi:hypothetical protein ACFWDN_13385 [Micromonospora chalcea]
MSETPKTRARRPRAQKPQPVVEPEVTETEQAEETEPVQPEVTETEQPVVEPEPAQPEVTETEQPVVEPEPAQPEVDQEAAEQAEETEAKGKLEVAIAGMTDAFRRAFVRHLEGETSAEYLSDWLERYGTPVSASSIRAYRRAQSRREGM